jgi:deoxyxylulose-5-phosphate synthase
MQGGLGLLGAGSMSEVLREHSRNVKKESLETFLGECSIFVSNIEEIIENYCRKRSKVVFFTSANPKTYGLQYLKERYPDSACMSGNYCICIKSAKCTVLTL